MPASVELAAEEVGSKSLRRMSPATFESREI